MAFKGAIYEPVKFPPISSKAFHLWVMIYHLEMSERGLFQIY